MVIIVDPSMCGLLLLHRVLPSPVPLHKAHYQAYLVMMMLIAMVLVMVTVMLMVLVMMTVIRMLRLMMLVVGDMGRCFENQFFR